MKAGLRAARDAKNFELIHLLFPQSLQHQHPSFQDVRDAVQANDPFTRRYLFESSGPPPSPATLDNLLSLIPSLMEACMTGSVTLFDDVWRFVRGAFQGSPALLESLGPRIDRALRLCTEGDLTPLMMVLTELWNDIETGHIAIANHPMVLAASCGHLPAVRLWLAQGIPAQWALPAALKHDHREVVSCLIAHGAGLSNVSSSEKQRSQ